MRAFSWASDRPVDCNEGAKGDVLLSIELAASENELADFEIVEDGKTWREWIVPAKLLNAGRRALLRNEDHIPDDWFQASSGPDNDFEAAGALRVSKRWFTDYLRTEIQPDHWWVK